MARINKRELILKHRPPNAGPGSSWRVSFEQLREDGWPGSATKHASFWGSNAKPALVSLGMRATMRKKDEVVEFRILETAPVVEEPTPEPAAEVERVGLTDEELWAAAEELAAENEVEELFRRFTAVATGRPKLKRGFGKVDIALAVVRAEQAT